jgi:hypothetical protein
MAQKVLLISPGGCACTAFIEFLSKYITINDKHDRDNVKHTLPWNPLIEKYNPTHIIYVYGDLDKAVRSLFRRNTSKTEYHKAQYYKLHNLWNNFTTHVPFNSFEDYINIVIKSRSEPLGIVNHYNAWKKVPNVFFIHYESIPTSTEIDAFLNIPKGTCSKFVIKDRTSEQNSNETPEYLKIINSFI